MLNIPINNTKYYYCKKKIREIDSRKKNTILIIKNSFFGINRFIP